MFPHSPGREGLNHRGLNTGKDHTQYVHPDEISRHSHDFCTVRKQLGEGRVCDHQNAPQNSGIGSRYDDGKPNCPIDAVGPATSVVIADDWLESL